MFHKHTLLITMLSTKIKQINQHTFNMAWVGLTILIFRPSHAMFLYYIYIYIGMHIYIHIYIYIYTHSIYNACIHVCDTCDAAASYCTTWHNMTRHATTCFNGISCVVLGLAIHFPTSTKGSEHNIKSHAWGKALSPLTRPRARTHPKPISVRLSTIRWCVP